MTQDTADPRHYFRLLLQRLLETQLCLKPDLQRLPPETRNQIALNASTLSEIKSWLEGADDNWEIVTSHSSARTVAVSGPGLHSPQGLRLGSPWSVLARPAPTEHPPGSQPAPSSPPSDSGPAAWARSTNGRITFLPKSYSGKLSDT